MNIGVCEAFGYKFFIGRRKQAHVTMVALVMFLGVFSYLFFYMKPFEMKFCNVTE